MTSPGKLDFGEIYDLHFAKIYNYVRYRVESAAAADDVASRVFERALDRLETFDSRKAPIEAWLFAIARNAVNDHLRAKRWLSWLPIDFLIEKAGGDPRPEEILMETESRREILEALRHLDERERNVLALKFGAGMTNRAIAGQSGLGESHIGVILYRAVKKLQSRLATAP